MGQGIKNETIRVDKCWAPSSSDKFLITLIKYIALIKMGILFF